ncbi:uncharacterized protein LOC111118810 isoform X5 [Crassostrea virginica]
MRNVNITLNKLFSNIPFKMATSLDSQCLSTTENVCHNILELEKLVEQKIKKLELDCSQLQLLFKPWPKTGKNVTHKEDDKTGNDTQSENKSNETPPECLTSDEKEALNAMEKLLAKAQKARTLQKKTEDCPRSYSRTHAPSSQKNEQKINEKEKPKNVLSNNMINSNSKSAVKKTAEKEPPKSNAFSRKPARNLHKSSSSTKNHVKAPFQTNPSLQFPKNSTNQEAMIKGTKSRRPGGIVRCGARPPARAPAVTDQVKSRGERHSPNLKDRETKQHSPKGAFDEDSCEQTEMSWSQLQRADEQPSGEQEPTVEPCHSETTATDRVSPGDRGDRETDSEQQLEDNRFHLYRDGNRVEIPLKLKKLVSMNHKLKQKLFVSRVTKKVDSTKSGQDFIDALEQMFEQDSRYNAAITMQRLESEFDNLRKRLDSLTVDLSSEETPAYEVFRTKSILELVLTRFYKLQEESLFENIECINEMAFCRADGEPEWKPSPPNRKSDFLWTPFSGLLQGLLMKS